MIEQFWLFHCGYVRVPEAAILASGSLRKICELPFLAAVAFHAELGPILVDAPFGHDGPHNNGALFGALMRSGLQEFRDEWSVIPRIEQLGLRPSEIDHILMTHLHFDHTGGMKELIHARFHIAQKEWAHAKGLSAVEAKIAGYAVGDFRALEARVDTFDTLTYFDPQEPGVDLFGDGSVLAISLPGHSAGHTGYLFTMADGQRVFFLGDAIFNLAHLEGTDELGFMPRQFAWDLNSARVTLDELRRYRGSNPELTYVCAHDFGWGEKCMSGPLQVL